MITTAYALDLVGVLAQSTVRSDEEQLALCDALAFLAEELGLPKEANVALGLGAAIRARDAAQLRFLDVFSRKSSVVHAAASGTQHNFGPSA